MNDSDSSQQVLCLGNALIDAFLTVRDANVHCHLNENARELCIRYGEKILLDTVDFCVGGNAANVSVGLSRFGIRSHLVAELGDDEFAQKILHVLKKEQVGTAFVIQTHGAASSFAIGLNFQGERTLFVEHVERKHDFSYDNFSGEWLYLTSLGVEWKAAYADVLEFAKRKGINVAYNPGSHQLQEGSDVNRVILKQCHVLFVNKEEAIEISNIKNQISNNEDQEKELTTTLLQTLQRMGPKIVVITDGKRGSFAIDREGVIHSAGIYPGNSIERTGAGDAYACGFLAAYIYGKPVKEAMRWGAINAASVIQKVGAQAGLLTRSGIEKYGEQ